MKQYNLSATYDELLLLDGKCREDIQKIVNRAKTEQSFGFEMPFMNEALRIAQEKGKLTWMYTKIRSCSYCDKQRDYYRYSRSSRHHRKGDKDTSRPIYYRGVDFNPGFIRIEGSGDICEDCLKKHNVLEQLIDYILEHDLKIEIQKNSYKPTRYRKDEVRVCFQCGKDMQESQMGKKGTLMGDGYYPATCPHCGAISAIFGKSHKLTDRFVMLPCDH